MVPVDQLKEEGVERDVLLFRLHQKPFVHLDFQAQHEALLIFEAHILPFIVQ